MDKETAKKLICDFIDSSDAIQDILIQEDVEEIDKSTLDEKRIIRQPTGMTTITITTYKEGD